MTQIIAIDFDETLWETLEWALAFNNFQIKGIPVTREDIEDYYIHNIPKFNLTLEESTYRFNSFLDSKEGENIKPVIGSKTKLLERKARGYDLYILTARQDKDILATKTLINKHFWWIFTDEHIIFANHFTEKSRSKADICEEINATIMIEDNLQYAEELAHKGITTYLLKKPRNKQYKNTNPLIIAVNSRQEISL